jgi:hypothetical protein
MNPYDHRLEADATSEHIPPPRATTLFNLLWTEPSEDITPYIDRSSVRRPIFDARRVNVDFPEWITER